MIKKIFINGIKAFLPVAVTFAIVYWIFNSIESIFGKLIQIWLPSQYYFIGLGTLLGILLVCAIGILVNAWVIKQLYHLLDWSLQRIPLIKTVYNSMIELVSFFGPSENMAQQAVLIDTPVGKVIGFVTRKDLKGLPKALGDEADLLVYVPFSYQLGGFTLSIPKEKLETLDMPVNEAMSLVLTAGLTGINKKRT
ncbi:MAG: DUF502 domain-containing protein [Gammaproteobacteria bacterium]